MRNCTCPDWEPNVNHINDALQMAAIHHSAYDLTSFKFCPWCGKKLIEKDLTLMEIYSNIDH
jgi:hypothetical protein